MGNAWLFLIYVIGTMLFMVGTLAASAWTSNRLFRTPIPGFAVWIVILLVMAAHFETGGDWRLP